jgi:alkaline phosphatase D
MSKRCRVRGSSDLLVTRRTFLTITGAAAGLAAAPAFLRAATPARKWARDPFSLGVASGTPRSDGFVIWTRLAPEPLSADPAAPGGMTEGDVPVRYEIATDEGMRDIVRTGNTMARARFAHAVHFEVRGLQPGRPYWYRFRCGDAQSRVGRALTPPRAGTPLERLRLGVVSCSNYEQGYFSAYRHLADESPDAVMYLGDYIYEYIDKKSTDVVRRHSDGVEAETLPTYRNRYAQYRLDEDLQRLHATAPALITWDDHEVQNDYGALLAPDFSDPARFRQRRAAAYRAFYEHMPLSPAPEPEGPYLRIYDRYTLGDLAEISMADERQYRSRAACYGPPDHRPGRMTTAAECPELNDATRSILGTRQEAWLNEGLAHSRARWNIIGQGVLMAQLRRRNSAGEAIYWTDDWNGYPASRKRLLKHIHDAHVDNAVVLGGDIHSFWANDLKLNFDDPGSPTVATEFVGTSITSHAPTFDFAAALPENPHVRFFDKSVRGYVSVDFTHERMSTRFQAISEPHDPKATVRTLRAFVVETGRPGVVAD